MTEPVDMAEPVDGSPGSAGPGGAGTSVLIAFGFLVAAVAIVGGAIAIVGSLTHGFKKPVVIHYKKSAVFSLKTGRVHRPERADRDRRLLQHTARRGGVRHVRAAGIEVAGNRGGGRRGQLRVLDPAQRVPEPAARDQPLLDLHLPRLGGLAGRHADRDLRGAGDEGQLTGSVQGANATAG